MTAKPPEHGESCREREHKQELHGRNHLIEHHLHLPHQMPRVEHREVGEPTDQLLI